MSLRLCLHPRLYLLFVFENTWDMSLGHEPSFLDVGSGVGTYVTSLLQFHPSVFGMDGRFDVQDILGEHGFTQDLTRPIPSPLRHCFDWVLTFNTAEHIPDGPAIIRFLLNLPNTSIIILVKVQKT